MLKCCLASPSNPSRPRRRRLGLGMEAVCQDGRGFEWRKQSARDSPVPAARKTAEDDDEDEKDWGNDANVQTLGWPFGPLTDPSSSKAFVWP